MTSFQDAQEAVFRELLSRSYTIEHEEEESEVAFIGEEGLPLFEEEDREILMHRDAHFSQNFSEMVKYYQNPSHKGVMPEIDKERIQYLASLEMKMKKNIAPIILSGSDAEKIRASLKLYEDLKMIAEGVDSPEKALALSILDESERSLKKHKKELTQKPEILLLLVQAETFYDPLSPGYGKAPFMAIELLGECCYEKSIPILFQMVGNVEFDLENVLLRALRKMKKPVKEFCMKILQAFPITNDHERAAIVLIDFLPDPEIEKLFEKLLQDERVNRSSLKAYLQLAHQ